MADSAAPALKEWFDAKRFRQIAREVRVIHPDFDERRFLNLALEGLDALTLMQRLRRATESLKATLPADYRAALRVLKELAPRVDHSFVTMVLPDYVGLYGLGDFDVSIDALEFFTPFGSSEFAVREFLRRDLTRTLAVMERWSHSESEHVRRLASEGCRPRLPWSFQLEALIADPSPVARVLENLKTDPSLYVRKSVANHLNDITKDHPGWVLDKVEQWPTDHPHTAWIVKRALRTLIKRGDARALAAIGAGGKPRVEIRDLRIRPRKVALGDAITLSFRLRSKWPKPQRLVVNYRIHYVKKLGGTFAKVFKLKEIALAARESVFLSRTQRIRNFTTRVHHPGRHRVEIMVNGLCFGTTSFQLLQKGVRLTNRSSR